MTRHDEKNRLLNMLDYAREAFEMARNHKRHDLDSDRQFRFALTHLVEIVGEAAAHVSQQFQQANPDIPWAGIIGLRNRLIHGYIDVDLDILWKIINDDLPPLIEHLQKILGEKR